MSFDKQGKTSGRRKARECALQMLFAADVVKPEEYSTEDFWLELGFGEVCPELHGLVSAFRERTEKIAADALDLKPVVRRADPLEKDENRLDELKRIASEAEGALNSFQAFVKGMFAPDAPELVNTRAHLERASSKIKQFTANFESSGFLTKSGVKDDDKAKFIDFKNRAESSIADLSGNNLPSIETLAETVRPVREFADRLATGTLAELPVVDEKIRTRAEHWRIERMAIVDRNVLRLAVYEFLFVDTPHTVVINEALEIARRFSTFEATQFINGILDAIKLDLEKGSDSRSVASSLQ